MQAEQALFGQADIGIVKGPGILGRCDNQDCHTIILTECLTHSAGDGALAAHPGSNIGGIAASELIHFRIECRQGVAADTENIRRTQGQHGECDNQNAQNNDSCAQ